MCRGEDLNLHTLRYQFLKLACLPFHHPGNDDHYNRIKRSWLAYVVTDILFAIAHKISRSPLRTLATATPARRRRASASHKWSQVKFAPSSKFPRDPASRFSLLRKHRCGSHKNTKSREDGTFVSFVRPVGIEPTTISLKGSCSTD